MIRLGLVAEARRLAREFVCAVRGHRYTANYCLHCGARLGLPASTLKMPMPPVQPPRLPTVAEGIAMLEANTARAKATGSFAAMMEALGQSVEVSLPPAPGPHFDTPPMEPILSSQVITGDPMTPRGDWRGTDIPLARVWAYLNDPITHAMTDAGRSPDEIIDTLARENRRLNEHLVRLAQLHGVAE